MKPSTKTTLSRKPQGQAETAGVIELQRVVDSCFFTFVCDVRLDVFPKELAELFDEKRERIVGTVRQTTRMVAFIRYHGDHMSLDIVFSKGTTDVQWLFFRYNLTGAGQCLFFTGEKHY